MKAEIGSLILRSDFFVAYGCGLVILILFCIERFNEPTNTDGTFVEALVPKALTNSFQYIQTFVIYVVILTIVYTGLSIIGPHIFKALGLIDPTAGFGGEGKVANDVSTAAEAAPTIVPAWVPLTVLLVLTGGATHFRVLNQVEFFARRLTHRLIGIPQNVETLAKNIQHRPIKLEHLSSSERDILIACYNQTVLVEVDSLRQVDAAVSANGALRRWLRLAYLDHVINTKDLPSGVGEVIRQEYGHVWHDVHRSISTLRGNPDRLRLLVVDVAAMSPEEQKQHSLVVAKIDKLSHDLHALIAIGVWPISKNASKVNEVTDALTLEERKIDDNFLLNRVLLALIALFFGVLALVFITDGNPVKALRWATGAFMLHGAAAIAGWRFYQSRVHKGTFISMSFSSLQIPTLQYIYVGCFGYMSGTLSLATWYALDHLISSGSLPNLTAELIWIPAYGVVGVMTAFWVTYDFDVVHQQAAAVVRRIGQVVAQAATTGVTAYFITITLQAVGNVEAEAGRALAEQVAITTTIAAGILGFIAVFLTRSQSASAAVSVAALAAPNGP